MSDSALFDVLILVVATVATGLLSYYDLPKRPHKLGAQETRASRALTDAYGYAVIVGCAIVGTHIVHRASWSASSRTAPAGSHFSDRTMQPPSISGR